MHPRARRILITVFVLAVAGGVVMSMLLPRLSPRGSPPPTAQQTQAVTQPPEPERSSETAATQDSEPAGNTSADVPPAGEPAEPIGGLHAVAPPGEISAPGVAPLSLGSLEPRDHRMQVQLSRRGAGIKSIAYSNIWETAFAKRQADAFYEAAAAGRTPATHYPTSGGATSCKPSSFTTCKTRREGIAPLSSPSLLSIELRSTANMFPC